MAKCCRDCRYSDYDAGANWKWYCSRKRTHVRADDYCGYFEPE